VTDLITYPLKRRYSKVRVSDFAKPWSRGGSFNQFCRSLPDILGVKILRAAAKAHRVGRPIIVGFGAHVITKVGSIPILVDLMRQGNVSALATNGWSRHWRDIAAGFSTASAVASGMEGGRVFQPRP